MQIKHIKKRSGKIRTIYAVNAEERRVYKDLLSKISLPEKILKHAHGFMPKRSIVTNALQHVKKKMTINMDLSDFFDSIKPSQVSGMIPTECYDICFLNEMGIPDPVNGAPRQGLPTSPAIANLAAFPMDKAIERKLIKLDIPGAVYTRYADDLSISCDIDSQEVAENIISEVKVIVNRCGFSVNLQKTRILRDKSRREICGIMVDDTIHMSRRQRRKLRSAKYNYAKAIEKRDKETIIERLYFKEKGLTEFSKLKVPNKDKVIIISEKDRIRDARIIARRFRIAAPKRVNKVIPEQVLGSGIKITNDPSMFYGMSSFTTGWSSCMALRNYGGGKGSAFWQRHPGVSIAYIDSGEKKSIEGVERPAMKARCLIYAIEGGIFAYDHIYDNTGHRHYSSTDHILSRELSKAGFISVETVASRSYISWRGERADRERKMVIGEVNRSCRTPYFDTLNVRTHYKEDGSVVWKLTT